MLASLDLEEKGFRLGHHGLGRHGRVPTPAALMRGVSRHVPAALRFSARRLCLVLVGPARPVANDDT